MNLRIKLLLAQENDLIRRSIRAKTDYAKALYIKKARAVRAKIDKASWTGTNIMRVQ